MSLEKFLHPGLVVLRPTATVYEAARAMDDNRIGAVLVADDHALAGLVTDRDLALRLVEADLDPREAKVADVMTPVAASCDVDSDVADVLMTMRQYACRRVPITQRGRAVGVVTLDDLVLRGAVNLSGVRAVIEAQLRQGARLKPGGTLRRDARAGRDHSGRRSARAQSSYHKLLHAVMRHAPPEARPHAEPALRIVVAMICDRLRPEDARRVLAQLPSRLAQGIARRLDAAHREIDLDAIEREIVRDLGVPPALAEELVVAVAHALADELSPGGLALLRGHLPQRMRELFRIDGLRETS